MRSRLSGWLGIGLITIGVATYGVSKYWLATRTLLALDVPVSLSRGHIHTGKFNINMQATYSIQIELDGKTFEYPADCEYDRTNAPLKTRWVAKRNGEVAWESSRSWGNSPAVGCFLGNFVSESGQYEIDIDVLSESSWLDARHPRLRIEASWWNYDEYSNLADSLTGFAVLFAVLGASLLFQSSLAPFGRKLPQEQPLKISSPRGNGYRVLRRDLPLMDPTLMLPRVGNVMGVTYFVIFITMFPFWMVRWPKYGIPVRLLRPGVIQASINGEATGLLVYVDSSGNLYLNSKPVTAEELPRALGDEFARRADWVAYVEGDSNLAYMAVVRAMDLVREAHGKVILLTPKMRAEAASASR